MSTRQRPKAGLSEEVLAAIEGTSTVVLESVKKELLSAVKGEVQVLAQRIDGHEKFVGAQFQNLQQRQEKDVAQLHQSLDKEQAAFERLSTDVNDLKRSVSGLQGQLAAVSPQSIREEVKRDTLREIEAIGGSVKTLADDLGTVKTTVKTLYDEHMQSIGVKKTLNWLWGAFGVSIVGLIGTIVYVTMRSQP